MLRFLTAAAKTCSLFLFYGVNIRRNVIKNTLNFSALEGGQLAPEYPMIIEIFNSPEKHTYI